ncbi:MAG TPA: choice-of-anchor D domain-containing protein, partial [Bacteroidota bacterium]
QTAAFVADKSALTFGNVVETQSSLDSIVVHNPDLLTLEIDAVSVIGTNATEFTASPSSGTVSAGGSMTFYITFTPSSPGSKSASVRFLHNAPGAAYSVSLTGTGTSAAATIASVSDLPLDQGGTVVVNWNKSPLDRSTSTIVNSYLVWRGIEAASVPSAANVVDRNEYVKRVGRNGPTPELFMSTGARHDMSTIAGNVYWQYLTSLPSHGLDHYSYAATTLADSVSAGIPWRYFFITASTADANVYWDSSPDSGYSVDNLAPSTPGGAALAPMPNGPMQITWNADRTDPDVGQYNVYRSTVSGFSIGPSSFLKSTRDTLVVDSTTAAGGTYYYRVSTVDIHGNMSVPTSQLGNTALALELASFTAVPEGSDGVVLSWTTATETSVYGYTVERRKDGDPSFEPVANAFIAGHGTSTDPHTYAFRDATAPAGVIWYRIKQADLNGTARYSLSVEVNLTATELAPNVFQLMQNYPNPFNPATEIKFSVAVTARTTVDVYNTLGQRVAALFDGIAQAGQYYRATLGGANLASGLYFARLQSGSSVATRKMMLLK